MICLCSPNFAKEVQEVSIRQRLNKSQSKALGKLKAVSEADFQKMVSPKRTASVSDGENGAEDTFPVSLKDLSAREIEAIAEKAITVEHQAERNQKGGGL